jgi:hypothetical protein
MRSPPRGSQSIDERGACKPAGAHSSAFSYMLFTSGIMSMWAFLIGRANVGTDTVARYSDAE